MAKSGKTTSALPDILGPLNVDKGGDVVAPPNDMAEVGGKTCHGGSPQRSHVLRLADRRWEEEIDGRWIKSACRNGHVSSPE